MTLCHVCIKQLIQLHNLNLLKNCPDLYPLLSILVFPLTIHWVLHCHCSQA